MKRSSLLCQLPPIRVLGVSLLAFTILLAACNGGGGASSPFPASIALTRIAGGFTLPVTITHADDGSGRLFVVEQGGTVRFIRNGAVAAAPFLNITSLVTPTGGEQGLLGLAFHGNTLYRYILIRIGYKAIAWRHSGIGYNRLFHKPGKRLVSGY